MAKQNQKPADVITVASAALTAAKDAVAQAEAMLASVNGVGSEDIKSNGSNGSTGSTGSKSSAGRLPSPEQTEIRQTIMNLIESGELQLFTIKGLALYMEKDRIQVRNAVAYLEAQEIVVRFAEKLNEGSRGNRELIYKPTDLEAGTVV